MSIPSSSGGSDGFSVSPSTLQTTAPAYHKAADNVDMIQKDLQPIIQQATDSMFLIYELARFANTLEHLHERINVAMECASKGLTKLGTSLLIAAEDYTAGDQSVSNTFKQIEDDPNAWQFTTKSLSPYPGFDPSKNEPVIPQPIIPQPVIPQPVIPQPIIPQPIIPQPIIPQPIIPQPIIPSLE